MQISVKVIIFGAKYLNIMKKTLSIIAIVLVILAVACYFFNPSRETHINAITEHYAKALNSDAQVVVDARSYSRVVLNHALEYNNYYVCSSSKMMGEPLTFGILGHVFVLEKK